MKNGINKSHLLKQKFVVCLLSFKYSFDEMKFYVISASGDKVSLNYGLSLDLLNTEHKPSVKITVDRAG